MGAVAQSQDSIRVATYNVGLKRSGPGLLLRDILSGNDAQVIAIRNTIAVANPDILLLTRFDFDAGNRALLAFSETLADVGIRYPYIFSAAPNSGVVRRVNRYDSSNSDTEFVAQGYGKFSGQGGMAILSRFPILAESKKDFSKLLWRDIPDARMPELADDEKAKLLTQRLSSVAHWDIPILLADKSVLNILAYHATTPVFDGPEDFNGYRNQDETLFWLRYLKGQLRQMPPTGKFVIVGDANLDPVDGAGRHQAIQTLLESGYVFDPEPRSAVGAKFAIDQLGKNISHIGDPSLDTANWNDDIGPGNLRVDYVLPSAGQTTLGAGIQWPSPGDVENMLGDERGGSGWHGLVWVDIAG